MFAKIIREQYFFVQSPMRLEVEIKESQEELEKAVKGAREASSKERLQMLYWLKSGQLTSRSAIAKRLGRDVATITRWLRPFQKIKCPALRSALQAERLPVLGLSHNIFDRAGHFISWRSLRKYKDGGRSGLLCVKHAPGKEPIVSGENLSRLKQRLEEPQGFHSYSQIQQWLESDLGLKLAYKTVYQLVRYCLGAKLKVPRPKSRKQHPQSQSHFKKNSL